MTQVKHDRSESSIKQAQHEKSGSSKDMFGTIEVVGA